MPFPANTLTLEKAWGDFRGRATNIKAKVMDLSTRSGVAPTQRQSYTELRRFLNDGLAQWVFILANTTDLEAYVQSQLEDPTINLTAEYDTMRDAVAGLRDWIDSNIPTHTGTGAVLERTVDGTLLVFTVAQTATFRTEADTVIAAIS